MSDNNTSLEKNRKVMSINASDNKYLHRDFHLTLNILLDYIYKNFGEEAVIDYITQYSKAYFKPLKEQLKAGNTKALSDYLTEVYQKEEWPVQIHSEENGIELQQDACPGITHIRSLGKQPAICYIETYRTLYGELCKGTPFTYTLEDFNAETGACKQLFIKS